MLSSGLAGLLVIPVSWSGSGSLDTCRSRFTVPEKPAEGLRQGCGCEVIKNDDQSAQTEPNAPLKSDTVQFLPWLLESNLLEMFSWWRVVSGSKGFGVIESTELFTTRPFDQRRELILHLQCIVGPSGNLKA
ncbi:hypothetical protein HZ326_14002 [Fusarium oxysporum f. sp. albedinis]|nr:hypothetical protein HZ326_14002 [Fusarium oxysporum f. sp. albedinis]